MNDRPQIDPRYDPAFQRGFTGEVQTGQHPHGVVRSSRPQTAPPTQAPDVASRPQRAEALPAASVPPAYAVAATGEQDHEYELEEAVVNDQLADDDAPARPMTRNPFLITLTLIGAALVVAGSSWAISGRLTMTDSGSLASERDYWFVQAALLGAPLMITAGVLIVAGVLFVFANAWNRAAR